MERNTIYISVGLMLACICIVACSQCNHWLGVSDDHLVEEIAEGLVERELGVELDFTPESPEDTSAEVQESEEHYDPR